MNESAMNPQEFAEFIEENADYITGPIEGADLFAMAQNLKVKLKGDLEVEETTAQGLKKLLITDESTLRGQNAEKKELSFPEQLELTLRVFHNHDAYPIKVYLRTRIKKETITFWIKIPDALGICEAAFDKVIEDVKEATGLPTLKGSF